MKDTLVLATAIKYDESEFKRFRDCAWCGEKINWNAPPINLESIEAGHYLDMGKETFLYVCGNCHKPTGGYIKEIPQGEVI